MTDFLTRLIARSLGTETTIRPRVASLFEPVRSVGAAFRETPAPEPVETTNTREVELESDGARKMNHPVAALKEERKVSDTKHSESPVGAMVPQPRGDSEHRRPTILADETREKEDGALTAKVRPRKAPFSGKENANKSELAPVWEPEDVATKNVQAMTPAASPIRDESFEKDLRGLLLPPKVATALTVEMKNAALAMNAGLSAPTREKARIPPALVAEPERSVQITIGRIEVRASLERESKPAGRPRPASPVMSLEEYLHRRTQRGGE